MNQHTGSAAYPIASAVRSPRGMTMLRADLRGLPNPEPVVALAGWASRLGPGDFLEAITDDPCAHVDFLRWCAGSGVELLEVHSSAGRAWRFLFHRPPVERPEWA
jgi:TusA-related sulfurtransferase